MSKRRDRRMMGRAFQLARLNQGLTDKNPSVGCIVLDASGHIVGAGVTGTGGRPHAEEIALEEAGRRARGGTAYVTLEPCRERSSGAASCSRKLVEAGIARVVVAIEDPHPTARDGLVILRDAGVRVETGLGKHAAARLYAWFFKAAARN
jgi:diaminohydroxyphosphoribosylaminopyrimidine deaminase/5-amino-6-(5-phosphoribosylamino)uracil reductase